MRSKNILIADPIVGSMNQTKWMFEYESLCMQEEQKQEDIVNMYKAVREGLINILGLDLMPIEDEDGKLRRPLSGEFMPLSVMIAREDIITKLSERIEEMRSLEDVDEELLEESEQPMSSEELEDFLKEDIVFLDDPEEMRRRSALSAPESKWVLSNVIKPLPVSAEEAALPKAKKTRVVIEAT